MECLNVAYLLEYDYKKTWERQLVTEPGFNAGGPGSKPVAEHYF